MEHRPSRPRNRGQRQGIAGDNLLEPGPAVARGKPGGDQIIGAAERLASHVGIPGCYGPRLIVRR